MQSCPPVTLDVNWVSVLPTKNGQKKVMSKRFNASNSLIKRELGIKFKESNYLQDLSFYLASLDIGDN